MTHSGTLLSSAMGPLLGRFFVDAVGVRASPRRGVVVVVAAVGVRFVAGVEGAEDALARVDARLLGVCGCEGAPDEPVRALSR